VVVTATFLVGDVYDRMAQLEDHSFDLIITSPPFLALRSYLPADHPDKDKEIGSETTPAEFLDTMLALTAEWRRLLAPHGSLAIELGDTYAGSGGAGGDYDVTGLREGQPRWQSPSNRDRRSQDRTNHLGGNGWPLDKSLTGIPTLYTWSLAYGRNLLTGQPSPAGQWRIRNLKPWIRTNPPVGALGDKERPATSYITVACTGRDRWFDLDAVRTTAVRGPRPNELNGTGNQRKGGDPSNPYIRGTISDPEWTGAPPLDWWHQIDAIIDDELNQRAGKTANRRTAKGVDSTERSSKSADRGGNWASLPELGETSGSVGAKGVHIRRRLEQAGHLHTLDALDISPRGYAGAHYAVWPPELVRQLVDEMCPRRVCTTCGTPSRRIVDVDRTYRRPAKLPPSGRNMSRNDGGAGPFNHDEIRSTLGWSDCGHNTWRPGRVLDPFVGSGTTLAVASGMGRDSVGIDLDSRNAHLAEQRVGMFLTVDWGKLGPTDELPPDVVDVIPKENIL
jgi:hypothetical protein